MHSEPKKPRVFKKLFADSDADDEGFSESPSPRKIGSRNEDDDDL